MPGEHLDLSSESPWQGRDSAAPSGRPFVGVRFACCDVYSRIYVNREQTAYVGHCPRCSKKITLRIGYGGTDSRFFTAY